MPDRYLREALLRSDRWNALSLDARDLYVRLLMIVDDFGCYDGREQVIAQAAYFLGRIEPLPLPALHESGLIVRYTNAGKPYIAMMRWGESLRGRRKYPAPPVCNDLAEVKYRGKYGTKLDFRNPLGTDPVSILIDLNGRAVVPQPPEWRRIDGDWMPRADATQHDGAQALQPQRAVTTSYSVQSLPAVTTPTRAETARSDSGLSVVSSQESLNKEQQSATPQPDVTSHSGQSPTTPTTGNGKIELLDSGKWHGLSEAQRLQWQEMFASVSVPDELDHAAQWLLSRPKERAAYTAQEDGLRAYIVRWLLREGRPPT